MSSGRGEGAVFTALREPVGDIDGRVGAGSLFIVTKAFVTDETGAAAWVCVGVDGALVAVYHIVHYVAAVDHIRRAARGVILAGRL
jgi:hypothetical protein